MKKNILIVIALVLGFLLISSTVNAAKPDKEKNLKQVYCNVEGKSGKIKAQISDGNTEHEKKLPGVFVENQSQVTAAMDAECEKLYSTPPKECPAGTTLVSYENNDFQKPICKGEPTGCSYGDQIPVDSPKCVPPAELPELEPVTEVESTTPEWTLTPDGGMKNPETGEVFYGK